MEMAESDGVIDELLDDHRRVTAIARRLDDFLQRETPPLEPEFAQLRWSLLREFTRHHAAERAALLRDRATAGTPGGYDRGLSVAFNSHMTEWTGAAVHARWPRYRNAARALLARLQQQMRHEEAVLFPTLRA